MPLQPAVFLDRDGTIIEAVHYLSDPAKVRLLPGAAEALKALRAAGYALVVVSNQSAVGRGLLTVEGLMEVHAEMCRQLAAEGAELDGFYFCAAVPAGDDRTAVDHPERKPAPGMLLRAAAELGLDLARSWMVGDMVSDVLAGRAAGCLGSIFVACGQGSIADLKGLEEVAVAVDLRAAAGLILSCELRVKTRTDREAPPMVLPASLFSLATRNEQLATGSTTVPPAADPRRDG